MDEESGGAVEAFPARLPYCGLALFPLGFLVEEQVHLFLANISYKLALQTVVSEDLD